VVITADEGVRAGKKIPLKANVDDALTNPETSSVQKVIVCKRTGGDIKWNQHRDIWYEDLMKVAGAVLRAERDGRRRSAVHPLHLRLHRQAEGRAAHHRRLPGVCGLTHERVFDYRPGEVYWCTADVGWVTGHSYIVYGPLANGATTLLFEGVPNYPDITRVAKIVDKHKVNILYTATAIRAMMASAPPPARAPMAAACACSVRWASRSTRSLGLVLQERRQVALPDRRHLVADRNRRQLMSPLPGAHALKPGSAARRSSAWCRRWWTTWATSSKARPKATW
jgi:acetyl-CoA synthetase